MSLDRAQAEMQRNHDATCLLRSGGAPRHWRNCPREHCTLMADAMPEELVPLQWSTGHDRPKGGRATR